MCGYVATCDVTTHYRTYHPFNCISSNSEGSKKLPDDGRLLPKYVEAGIQNKGVVKLSSYGGHL
jgi:hypothetical protein